MGFEFGFGFGLGLGLGFGLGFGLVRLVHRAREPCAQPVDEQRRRRVAVLPGGGRALRTREARRHARREALATDSARPIRLRLGIGRGLAVVREGAALG